MNYIDLIIVILFIWAAYRGFTRGFVVMIAVFIALVAGVWGAFRFSGLVAHFLVNTMNASSPYMHLVSFTITFILIVIAVNIVAYLLSRLLDIIALGFINRLLGSLFGVLKMTLILSILFLIFNAFNDRLEFFPKEEVDNSLLYRPVASVAPGIFPFLNFDSIVREIENLVTKDE